MCACCTGKVGAHAPPATAGPVESGEYDVRTGQPPSPYNQRRLMTTRLPCQCYRIGVMTLLAFALPWLAGALAVHAHPLSQGALDVVVHPDHVVLHARLTFEEVAVTDMLTAAPGET